MERYRNLAGESGITSYEILPRAIAVRFRSGEVYLYDEASTGSENIRHMKELALMGRGLSTFISQKVRRDFARRIH